MPAVESPIEERLARGLVKVLRLKPEEDFFAQHWIGPWRVDFLIPLPDGRRLVVECDGAEFHGAQQQAYDEARQYDIERRGFLVLRASGREINYRLWQVLDRIAAVMVSAGREPPAIEGDVYGLSNREFVNTGEFL